ncbi:Man1-Src1p-C-terminal domain [Nesidiocoris tenuis]|uniref:Man1-Src1p-C-terminal domain n=1 Tax=Nesidiocoris tenuis TaxID=355587 RepID=A0ABN7AM21_9HEMI|nr:Man1-Src1p-C-terminal domain [Nesidiocoris tenuis]
MDLDNLSDAQIRNKFIEFGQPVGPVTPTTRKYMIRRLKTLIASGARPVPSTSGEESDGGRLTPRSKRKTFAAPAKAPRRRSSGRTIEPIASSTIIEPQYGRRSTRSSDRDDSPPSQWSKYTPANAQRIGTSTFATSLNSSPTSNGSPIPSPERFGSYRPFSSPESSPTLPTDNSYDTEYRRRISAIRARELAPPGLNSKVLDLKESDDEDAVPMPNFFSNHSSRPPAGSRPLTSKDPKVGNRPKKSSSTTEGRWFFQIDSAISAVLLLLLLLFFAAIGVVYVNKAASGGSLAPSRAVDYAVCGDTLNDVPDVNCVPFEDLTYVELMMAAVLDELAARAAAADCSSTTVRLSDVEMLNAVVRHDKTLSYYVVEKNLNNLKIAFEANPKLKVNRTKEGVVLTDVEPTLSCRLSAYLTRAADWTIKGCLATLTALALYVGVRWWLGRAARHREDVYLMAGNIVDVVSARVSATGDAFTPIELVRDELIPLRDRQRCRRVWEDAVRLLDSDTRLRKEIQEVHGEEFLGWRWLSSNLTANKKKVWQGQAFDTLEGNLNSHVDSPSNCLKIRHMFEPGREEGDDWVTTVVDAILEKCGEAKVLHIYVQRQSAEGLVYMKCATPEDAGIAYRAMHGSWFASNLITVKYVREYRYHERFPDSIGRTVPLRPSNDSQRSLS